MRISGDWLTNPATQAVCAALTTGGKEAFFVGGCVRNALLGTPVNDIDIASNATPQQVADLVEAAGLRAVPTGIEHGTITVVAEGIPHEVTTYRKDVETDGRRAVVAYAETMEEDARRRDFTMNALYCDASGLVLDPLGQGLADLRAHYLRFIDDPEQRIREDYLRILRFFRFHAWYGDPMAGLDPEALAAIAANLDGIETLSRERIGAEVVKLLGAADPAPAVAAMRSSGALQQVLPGADDQALAPLIEIERMAGMGPDPIRRMAALGPAVCGKGLRLSNGQKQRLSIYQDGIGSMQSAGELGYRHGVKLAEDVLMLRAAMLEQLLDPEGFEQARIGAASQFPVRARDLMPGLQGPALGRRLKEIEARWIASGFALDRAALLAG